MWVGRGRAPARSGCVCAPGLACGASAIEDPPRERDHRAKRREEPGDVIQRLGRKRPRLSVPAALVRDAADRLVDAVEPAPRMPGAQMTERAELDTDDAGPHRGQHAAPGRGLGANVEAALHALRGSDPIGRRGKRHEGEARGEQPRKKRSKRHPRLSALRPFGSIRAIGPGSGTSITRYSSDATRGTYSGYQVASATIRSISSSEK